MKTNNFLILSVVSISLLVSACAKQRPVEKVRDPDKEVLSKETLTGSGKDTKLWMMKVTTTRQTANGGFVFPGLQSETKLGTFRFTKDSLRFENVITPYAKKKNSQSDRELIEEWSIRNTDKRLAESDGKVTNREVEDDTISFDKKRFFTIDWSSSKISEIATFPYYYELASFLECWGKASASLVDGSREVSEDYVSFTIRVDYVQNPLCASDNRRHVRQDFTYTVNYKYSFMRHKKSDYKPYVYTGEFDPLKRKYGYFGTELESVHSDLKKVETADRFSLTFLMNRWKTGTSQNPITHHFFFAPDAAEEFKWTFNDPKIGIIARTNEMLKRNNVGMRFAIHNSDWCDNNAGEMHRCTVGNKRPREFGDIRYSFVQILNENTLNSPLGYGPHTADPLTGEIISATTVLYYGMMKSMIYQMKTMRDRDPVKFSESSLYNEMKKFMAPMGSVQTVEFDPKKVEDWALPMEAKDPLVPFYDHLLTKLLYGNPSWYILTVEKSGRQKETSKNVLDTASIFPYMHRGQATEAKDALEPTAQIVKDFTKIEEKTLAHPRNSTLHFLEPALLDARRMIVDGMTAEEAIKNIAYNVALHEFGHNLSLRHNFFGSVDKKNWGPETEVTREDAEGKKFKTKVQARTSSVMEYTHMRDESALLFGWGKYDEAAITYAHTDGKTDLSKKNKFLYCTDEHLRLNAMCNHFDRGTTPSEVLMSLVENYEDAYAIRNLRFDRAYWNASSYLYVIYSNMRQVKKFLAMKQQGFSADSLRKELAATGKTRDEVEQLVFELTKHLNRAVTLSLAFYQSVIQQQDSDRPFDSRYDEFTGALERMGILYDKVFAMYFAMNDDLIMNSPNQGANYTSYLRESGNTTVAPILQKFMENALTMRVDMRPWFIGFARVLYAINATNYENLYSDASLIHKIKVSCFSAKSFEEKFGIKASAVDHMRTTLTTSHDDYFVPGDEISIVKFDGKMYVSSRAKNPYAFNIISNIETYRSLKGPINHLKQDVVELFTLYRLVTTGSTPTCDD